MKILQISPRYQGGGAERSARELFHALREQGHSVGMWTAVPERNTPADVHCIRGFAERLLFPVNYLDPVSDWRHFAARRKIDAIQPGDFDVIHLHNIHGHWLSIKALYRVCQRVPVVWSLRDGWAAYGGVPYDLSTILSRKDFQRLGLKSTCYTPLTTHSSAASRWRKFLNCWMPQPARLLCPSLWIKSKAEQSGFFHNRSFEHLPNGVSMTISDVALKEKPQAKQMLGLQPEAKTILFIAANLNSPYKGIRFGLEAITQLVESGQQDNLQLIFLGRSAESLQAHLPKKLPLLSFYANTLEELITAYCASDVTVVPSIAEQFGLVAAESLYCKTPVACFDVGGLSEIIGANERGLKVAPLDVTALAHAIQSLLDNRELNRDLGECGHQWVVQNCHYGKHVERTVQVYRDVIEQFQ